MTVALHDIQSIQLFASKDTSGINASWKRWISAFELYAEAKGVTEPDQKKSLLLHSVGMDVQDVFVTLPNGEGDVPFERHKFRTTDQGQGESVEQYIVRLRQKAEPCEFGNNNAVEIQIRDQVIKKCKSHKLRRKLLEKGRDLSLRQLRDISRAFEDSEQQATMIEGAAQEENKLSVRNKSVKGNRTLFNREQLN